MGKGAGVGHYLPSPTSPATTVRLYTKPGPTIPEYVYFRGTTFRSMTLISTLKPGLPPNPEHLRIPYPDLQDVPEENSALQVKTVVGSVSLDPRFWVPQA